MITNKFPDFKMTKHWELQICKAVSCDFWDFWWLVKSVKYIGISNNCRETETEAELDTVSFTPKEEKMF